MTSHRRRRRSAAPARAAGSSGRSLAIKVAISVGAGLLVLAAIFWWNDPGSLTGASAQNQAAERDPSAGKFDFRVGKPGSGANAPAIRLASTAGRTFDLASLRGQRVLLFFQEGLMCQPCWNQIRDIESNPEQLRALDVKAVVSITTDPIANLTQKAAYEGLSTPVLSDPDLTVSRAYNTNNYGMMGGNYNGHSFILVGEDGRILWRADYGGAPKYHMYIPVENLLADLRQGLGKAQP